jgi:predicted ATPase/DNA-binding SARP family transcriptional activator
VRGGRGPAEQTHSIRLELLGGMRLLGAGGEQATDHTARHHVRAVLALAGASAHGIERDALADALWPESSTEAARNRLYHTVHLARRALSDVAWEDDWIVVRQGRVVLDERVACDAQQLERCSGMAGPPAQPLEPQQILALCQADWMPELQVGALSESVRSSVRARQVQALQQAVLQVSVHGDSPILRALLQTLLRIRPTDEAASRVLMQLDLQAGRPHAVLRAFEQVSRALGTQLGLRPGDATCALAAEASQQMQYAPELQEHNAKWALVGREALVRDLVKQVTAQAGVWNLSGLGGIGKTSVAKEVANRVAPLMEDGVVIVSLGDLQAYGGVAAACAHSMALSPTPGRTEMALLAHAVRARKMLLVLDDVDTAEDLPALLDAMQADPLKARVLLLTRSRIDERSVRHVEVQALSSPAQPADVSLGLRTASFALFQMRCPMAGPEQATPAWQADVMALLHRLEGLPLAIELAAARTASLTPGEILAEIERGAMLADEGPVDLQGRHRSLQASLDWSVGLLSERARRAYRALSVFPGAFAPEAARPLMAVVGVQSNAADAALDELLSAGLVKTLDEDREPQRLRLLHLPRAHARAKATVAGQWHDLQAARLTAVCRFLDDNALEYESPQFAARQERVMTIEEDAVALLGFAQHNDPERFVRMLVVLCETWTVRASTSVLLRWVEPGIACAQQLALPDKELLLRRLGLGARRVRDGAQAVVPALAAMTDQLQDPRLMQDAHRVLRVRASILLASNMEETGRVTEAEELMRATFAELRLKSGDPGYWLCQAMLCGYRRDGQHIMRNLDTLRARLLGSPGWLLVLDSLLYSFAKHNDHVHSIEVARETLQAARALHSVSGMSKALWYLADGQLAMDDPDSALETSAALIRLSRHGHSVPRRVLAHAVWFTSAIHWRRGHLDAAERCLNDLAGPALLDDRLSVRIALVRSTIRALSGRCEEAAALFAAVPMDDFGSQMDEVLVHWGETAALIANCVGDVQRARALARLFRLIDVDDDLKSFICRSRDQHFGRSGPTCQPSKARVDEARIELRAAIREFHAHPQAAIAPRAADASCDNTNVRARSDRMSALLWDAPAQRRA